MHHSRCRDSVQQLQLSEPTTSHAVVVNSMQQQHGTPGALDNAALTTADTRSSLSMSRLMAEDDVAATASEYRNSTNDTSPRVPRESVRRHAASTRRTTRHSCARQRAHRPSSSLPAAPGGVADASAVATASSMAHACLCKPAFTMVTACVADTATASSIARESLMVDTGGRYTSPRQPRRRHDETHIDVRQARPTYTWQASAFPAPTLPSAAPPPRRLAHWHHRQAPALARSSGPRVSKSMEHGAEHTGWCQHTSTMSLNVATTSTSSTWRE